MNSTLPQEMEQHTYAIMNRVEDSHWWFVGRRAILEAFLTEISKDVPPFSDVPPFPDVPPPSRRLSRQRLADDDSNGTDVPPFSDVPPSSRRLSRQRLADDVPSAGRTRDSRRDGGGTLRILDVGCGTGANLEMLSQFGDAEGVDVSDDALEFCVRKGLKAHKGLAEKLPFEDESFDVATALDVVEHLDDDIAGLREMHRVLKPGGKSLIFVPAFMWLWGVQDDISNHRIRYTRKQIVERLEAAGFEVERATYANWTFFVPILAGRIFMRLTGLKPESENNINVSALNGIFGKIFSAERFWLRHLNFPFGVSIVVVARKLA